VINEDGKKIIRIRRGGNSTVSPFIVRLSRPGEIVETSDPLADLRASLVIDGDEEESAEADLVEATDGGVSLAITFDEFRDQLMEDAVPVEGENEDSVILRSSATKNLIGYHSDPSLALRMTAPTTIAVPILDPIATEDIEVAEVFSAVTPLADLTARIARVFSSKRALASFVLLALFISAPLHAAQVYANVRSTTDSVKSNGSTALDAFLRGATSLSSKDFASAGKDFSKAAEDFANAEDSLNSMHAVVTAAASVIPQTERTMSSVRHLATAGEELANTAEILSLAGQDIAGKKSLTVVDKIDLLSTYVGSAEPHVITAAEAIQKIDEGSMPEEYAGKIHELKSTVPALASALHEFTQFTNALTIILGGKGEVRYLAAFQNNTEIRATGGFVGSFAELDVKNGVIERLSVPGGGSYSAQGQLTEYVAAPGPMHLLRPRWEFQDANWFPDFPTSAKKMLWFQEHSGGPTMDGVIAVNASFIVDLLKIVGPVDMPQYKRTINADNFLIETQKIVELEYDKSANKPKAFIGDLAPLLLKRVTDADFPTLTKVLSLVGQGLQEKDIMVYFSQNDLEATMDKLGFTGSLKQTTGDSLMIVDTNLGGGKTDGVIDEQANVEVEISEDGTVVNTVTVTRTHRGMKSELFRGVNNVDYIRLYVPEGSQIMNASGFTPPAEALFKKSDVPLSTDEDLALNMQDIGKDESTGTDVWNENGKTVFGNWVQTAPGTSSTVTFTYKLPFKVSLAKATGMFAATSPVPYSLFVQKQSGVENRRTDVRVSLPHAVEVIWTSSDANSNVTGVATNERDSFFGWLFQP
jgi:hypothetical protein